MIGKFVNTHELKENLKEVDMSDLSVANPSAPIYNNIGGKFTSTTLIARITGWMKKRVSYSPW